MAVTNNKTLRGKHAQDEIERAFDFCERKWAETPT